MTGAPEHPGAAGTWERPAASGHNPLLTIVVYGQPAPQGSKRAFRNKHTGKIQQTESSQAVAPWRQDVKDAAEKAMHAHGRRPLDGPLAADMVFTVGYRPASKPGWWPKGVRWSKHFQTRPAGPPDISKLVRATEDALTNAGAIKDDARIVSYRRLEKFYADHPDPDALDSPGAVIRLWEVSPS